MKCNQCGNLMEDSTTTFTVVKGDDVYVVENVPCLECPVCEHISFTQNVAKKLELYASGRLIPIKTKRAWAYKWQDPIIEVPKIIPTTVNVQFVSDMRGTSEGVHVKNAQKASGH
jgi:YgiT-type zinc finger domain-containing protein